MNIRRIVRVAAVTAGVFWLSSVVPRDSGSGSAQLVSIQEFGELCPPEAMGASTGSIPGEDTNLFADFRDGSVYAAGQETGSTSEVTRPPVRSILDKDPIYASVGVDTRLNEVFLQDSNTWSIRVFNRLDNTPADAMRPSRSV